MTYCERINDPQYRINLEQLTKILGDSNAATAALESNNGFSLDKAPNGKDSFLYLSLYDTISEKYPDLSEEEKIEKVTKLKLLTYSPEFKEWFGDWENDPTNASKVVDDNGEPLIVYHASKSEIPFEEFSHEYTSADDGFYFTDSKEYMNLYNYTNIWFPVFLSIKNPHYNNDIIHSTVERVFSIDYNNLGKPDGIIGSDRRTKEFQDSLKYPHKEFVILKSNQIKSVENNGQYSLTDDNIYHENIEFLFNTHKDNDTALMDLFSNFNTSNLSSIEIPIVDLLKVLKARNASHVNAIFNLLANRKKSGKKTLLDGVSIILEDGTKDPDYKYRGARAYYDNSNNTIHVNVFAKYENGISDEVILHEIMHAITLDRIHSDKALYQLFVQILNDYQARFNDPRYTGEHALEEFIANIWSDPRTINNLKRTPSPRAVKSSLWLEIRKFISDIFIKYFGGGVGDKTLFAEASLALYQMLDNIEYKVSTDIYREHLSSLNQDTKDILSLIKYQFLIQFGDPEEFKIHFLEVIKGYLSGESWAIDLVKSLVDKVLIRLTQLHVLGYDYNEESYDENGVFEWEKYLGGIDLNKEIEELSEEDKLKFTPIENYQVSLAEIIMPKLYRTQFHLGNHSIAEIDKDFFKKTNSFYYSDLKTFSKEGLLESKAKIDFLVRCHNYKFNIVVSDSLSTPPAKNLKPIEVEVVDGYRMKNGERMYALPDRSEYLIYKDSKGNETIVFKNSESVESSIKDLINSLDDKDLVSVLAFLENLEPTKDWLRYVMNINHIKTGNSSLKKLINENLTSDEIRKELLEIYYENSDIYKDLYGRRPNKYKEELAETLYNSFLKTLEVISVRIPTQAFLSIMAAKVVGFTNDDFNNVFVTRWLFWLLGSDLDIKKY